MKNPRTGELAAVPMYHNLNSTSKSPKSSAFPNVVLFSTY